MKKKLFAVLLCLIMLSSALGGCGDKGKTDSDESTKSESAQTNTDPGEPKDGGQLVIALAAIAKTIDPVKYTGVYEGNIIAQVANGLVAYNQDMTDIIPSLATEWSISEDGMEYTFKLREGVKFQKGQFQDGREFTAEDVKYSLERSAKESAMNRLSMLDHVEVISPTEAKCVLTEPNAAFLTALTDRGNVIVPKEEVEGHGDNFSTNLIGTGPFALKEWKADDQAILERNEDYWGERPHLDGITFRFITDGNMMVNALRSGEIHIATDLTGENIKIVQDDSSVIYEDMAGLQISYLYFNLLEGPTKDINVRKAMIMATDIDAMVDGIYRYGEAQRAYLPLPPGSWGYDSQYEELIPAYNPEEAKKLLEEAGYGDGFSLEIHIADKPARVAAATIFQQNMKENLNIDIQIKTSEWGVFSEIASSGKADIYGMSWTWYPDPFFFLNNLFDSSQIGSLGNGQGFNMPEMDELLGKALEATDQAERAEYYKQALGLATEQYAQIVYSNEKICYGFSPKVQGFEIRADKQDTFVSDGINVWLSE
ncbi:MAG: ABC transporter substrate-binding protein [Lachnospiraceae bacterium]